MKNSLPRLRADSSHLLVFVILVIGMSWLQFLPGLLENVTGVASPTAVDTILSLIFLVSPITAAVFLIARTRSEAVRPFLRERLRWRVPVFWYVVAFAMFPLVIGVAIAVFVAAGEPVPTLGTAEGLLVVEAFTVGIVANLFENYGWRGYLQEGLQWTTSAVVASVGVGLVWGLWHAPLFLVEDAPLADISYAVYLVMIVGVAIIFGWVYNGTGGSVLVVALMQCAFNATIAPLLFSLMNAGGDATLFLVLTTVIIWVAAGGIVVRTSTDSDSGEAPPGGKKWPFS